MENNQNENVKTKFCKFCGAKIPEDAVLCTSCGRQFEELKGNNTSMPNIVINNDNNNINTNVNRIGNTGHYRKRVNKWVAFIFCLFLGYFGAHKFYEGRKSAGLLYLFTIGLFGIGWFVDIFLILAKPNPYYV